MPGHGDGNAARIEQPATRQVQLPTPLIPNGSARGGCAARDEAGGAPARTPTRNTRTGWSVVGRAGGGAYGWGGSGVPRKADRTTRPTVGMIVLERSLNARQERVAQGADAFAREHDLTVWDGEYLERVLAGSLGNAMAIALELQRRQAAGQRGRHRPDEQVPPDTQP